MKNPWVVIAVIVALLVGGSVWYSMQVSAKANIGVVITPHTVGRADAPVKLVEYSDFQCPACGQFQPIVEEILAEYGDKIHFEYKHFPLTQIHPFAQPAAIAAEAAGQQGKFFEYASLLFKNQATWSKSSAPSAFFTQYATELGLDIERFTKQQHSSLLKGYVMSQFNEARGLGLTGTPSFYLNGEKLVITTIEDFKAQIERAIDPTVDFSLEGADAPLKVVPLSGDTDASSTVVTTPTPGVPAVQFGI